MENKIEVIDKDTTIPPGVKGWSWGAFLLNWIWALGNRTWIGLLCLIPYLGLVFAIVLGFKGREWAWKNKKWNSVEHFNSVQKKWNIAGIIFAVCVAIFMAISVAQYNDYLERTRRTDARGALLEIAAAEERIYFERNQYTNAMADVWTYQEGGTFVSNEGHYALTVVLTDDDTNRFTATATARGMQAGDADCATFTIDEKGFKAATGDDPTACW